LKNLRDLGNTVVVVEHDELMMREADHIIDMGPFASHLGGEVVAEGDFAKILKAENSLTAKYLKGELKIDIPEKVRTSKQSITIEGATENNLKSVDVEFPLGILTVVSGVSGSGKTTLVKKILYPALVKHLTGIGDRPGQHKSISGALDTIKQVEMVDQTVKTLSYGIFGNSSRDMETGLYSIFDENNNLVSTDKVVLSEDEYLSWQNNDQYIINLVATKLGFVLVPSS
jgi:excinuclease ABC subunit A